MTVQFPQIDASEPRLLTDSYSQKSSDHSFEDKLKLEQARLGLLFSPFAQLGSLFFPPLSPDLGSKTTEGSLNSYLQSESQKTSVPETGSNVNYAQDQGQPGARVFESIPLQTGTRQSLQQLLSQTSWLVPNLEAQPLFYQAFTEGKLQLKLDMQSLIDEIIKQVSMVKEKGRSELSLTLNPKELGEIVLVLTSRAGMVSIEIQSSAETKKLIDAQRSELEAALKKAKVNFDKIRIEEVDRYA